MYIYLQWGFMCYHYFNKSFCCLSPSIHSKFHSSHTGIDRTFIHSFYRNAWLNSIFIRLSIKHVFSLHYTTDHHQQILCIVTFVSLLEKMNPVVFIHLPTGYYVRLSLDCLCKCTHFLA